VLVEGKPQGVVSRQDLLGFLGTEVQANHAVHNAHSVHP
jgi:hypothetical protein